MVTKRIPIRQAKVRPNGTSYVITIPKDYLDNGLIKVDDVIDAELIIEVLDSDEKSKNKHDH